MSKTTQKAAESSDLRNVPAQVDHDKDGAEDDWKVGASTHLVANESRGESNEQSDAVLSKARNYVALYRRGASVFGFLRDDVTPCGVHLPIAQAHALMALLDDADPVGLRVSDLHARLQLDMSNVSRRGARMEQAGLVVRRECPDDARAVRLVLTSQGRQLAERVDRRSRARFERLLDAIDPSDRLAVLAAIDTLVAALQRTNSPKD